MSHEEELARLDKIRREYEAHGDHHPAWLTTLGLEDLEAERRLIVAEMQKKSPSAKGNARAQTGGR